MKTIVRSTIYNCWRRFRAEGRIDAKAERTPADLDKFLEYFNFFFN
ncbi:MAG: hypothetical protein M0017_12010 [Desulfobacteraceae bacterium]|nr:hypothetical protein [Desulfobacteraceae bacterium]